MKHTSNNGILGEDSGSAGIKEKVASYLSNWPIFVTLIALCLIAGISYIRYTAPRYMATTSFLIKGTDDNKNSQDLIDAALNGKREINLNNEILQVSSANVMERNVFKNGFNISYLKKGKLVDIEIYKDAPFIITAKQLTDSNASYEIYISKLNDAGGTATITLNKQKHTTPFTWDKEFTVGQQAFVAVPKKNISDRQGEFIVKWEPVKKAAAGLLANLNVKAFDNKTSVLNLTLKTTNLQKGVDVLNGLYTEFNKADIEERSKLSESTVRFIDDRLLAISQELKGVEGSLENFQGSRQLVDIKGQTSQSLENSNFVSQGIKDLSIQKSLASMLAAYFANPANGNKLVPSSLGLNDPTLSSLVNQYNELQLKREREAPQVAPNSTVMVDINNQLANLKGSIQENLRNINRNFELQENNLRQQSSQYQNTLSTLPHNERVLKEIKRKQNITEGLYLYLFQKREEAAISSTASNIPHYKQIDLATGFGPVEPGTVNILLYATMLGFSLAFGIVYLRTALNDTIVSKDEVTRKLDVPVVGQIGHLSKKKRQSFSILERDVVSEQFRAIRTNLSFTLKQKNAKTILVTSSVSDEGKSFISLNLAAVFAVPGKKVAMLEFDIRRPAISNRLSIDSSIGLTNYLVGEISNIDEIAQPSPWFPTLDIFPCGPLDVNPADLLLTDNMTRLFDDLKARYDYIVIDCSPASLVSDPFIIGEYSDIVLYVVRNQKTKKKSLEFIQEVVEDVTLKNVAVVINDVKSTGMYEYNSKYYQTPARIAGKESARRTKQQESITG